MGGSRRAIEKVAHVYDVELLRALRAGEVYDKEEPILTVIFLFHLEKMFFRVNQATPFFFGLSE